MIDLIYWMSSFWISLVCGGIQLHFIFLHEDLDEGYREPYEISDALYKFTPIEIFLQLFTTIFSLFYFYLPTLIPSVILSYFNVRVFLRKDYCQHFLTRREYNKRDMIEKYIKYKLVIYLISIAVTLIFSIICIVNIVLNRFIFIKK